MTAALEFTDVSVRYRNTWGRGVQALDGMDLVVEPGAIFGLLGPNGAGKSTAVYVALGLIRPQGGSCRVFGRVLERGSEAFHDIGYLPEEAHYHNDLTVREALTIYALLSDPARSWPVDETLDRVGMLAAADRRLGTCSKGMRQRLGLAQAIIHRPRLLILDEPTRGLDPVIVHSFRVVLEELAREGTTIFLNSHVLSEVEQICTRVAILTSGRVALTGSLKDLLPVGEGYRVRYATADGNGGALLHGAVRRDDHWEATVPEAALDAAWTTLRAGKASILLVERHRQSLEELFVRTVSTGTVSTGTVATGAITAGAHTAATTPPHVSPASKDTSA